LLARLFAIAFRGDALKGHNFGNLFVAALTEITGDFGQAIQLASKILATAAAFIRSRRQHYPGCTYGRRSLVRGETSITASKKRIAELMLDRRTLHAAGERWSHRAGRSHQRGPGSLYTSLIANLLVQGIPALAKVAACASTSAT